MFCDLHTHSVFSDGSYTPAELIDAAIDSGLSAIALTDHNTVDGLPDFISYAKDKNINIVPGAEFSCDYKGTELHIHGLFISPRYFDKVSSLMDSVIKLKEESNRNLVKSLNLAGYSLDFEAIRATTPNGKINRSHIARAMVERGYISSVKEGFETLLSKTGGFYQEPKRLSAAEVIDFINSIGAVAVLAHPFLNLNEDELCRFLEETEGLCGMECYYASYDEETMEKSINIAHRFGLIKSGGSDFHGTVKPGVSLGTGKGDLRVPYECYDELLSYHKNTDNR